MDCLITQLPGEVTDDTLSKYNEVSFEVSLKNTDSTNDRKFVAKSSASVTARIVGNGHFTDSTNSQDLGKTATIGVINTTLYLSDGDYILYIPKYGIDVLQFSASKKGIYKMRGESFKYSPIAYSNFNYFQFPEGYSIDDFKKTSLIILNVANSNLNIRTEQLTGLASTTTINIASNINVRGLISALGGTNKAMTTLYVNGCQNVTGDIEDLMDALYSNGKVSGSISVNGSSSGVKYNGASFALKTFTFGAGGWSAS